MKLFCQGGPYDGRMIGYREPLPRILVFADRQLHYHEYRRSNGGGRVYRWERSYRIPLGGSSAD